MDERAPAVPQPETRFVDLRIPFAAVLTLAFKAVIALIIVLAPVSLVAYFIWLAATNQ